MTKWYVKSNHISQTLRPASVSFCITHSQRIVQFELPKWQMFEMWSVSTEIRVKLVRIIIHILHLLIQESLFSREVLSNRHILLNYSKCMHELKTPLTTWTRGPAESNLAATQLLWEHHFTGAGQRVELSFFSQENRFMILQFPALTLLCTFTDKPDTGYQNISRLLRNLHN